MVFLCLEWAGGFGSFDEGRRAERRSSLPRAQGTGALRLLFEKMEARAASRSPTLSHGRTSPTRSRRSKTPSSLRPTPLPHATPAPAPAVATATAAGPRVQTPTPAELMASLEAPRRVSPPRRAVGAAVAVADAEVAAVNRVEAADVGEVVDVEVPASAQPLALPTWRKSRRAEVVEARVEVAALPPPRPTALDAEHDHGLRSMQEQPPLA